MDGNRATLGQVRLKSGKTHSVSSKSLFADVFAQAPAETVAMLVMYDEPTETINRYAPYTLKINGVVQPGG